MAAAFKFVKHGKIKQRPWLGLVIIPALLLALVIVIGRFGTMPSKGKTWVGQPQDSPSHPVAKPVSYISLKGQYFNVKYPSLFIEIPRLRVVAPTKEVYAFASDNTKSETAGISVRSLEGQPADQDPSLHMRLTSTKYQQHAQNLSGEKVYVFTRSEENFEAAAFMVHHGLIASIALTSPLTLRDELNQELQVMLISWQWLR